MAQAKECIADVMFRRKTVAKEKSNA